MLKSLLKIFSSEKENEYLETDFSSIGTDMHSHLIPGIDDGAKTIEDSIELIRFLHSMGYSKLITTPHIMSDYFRNTPETILGGLADVQKAIAEQNIPVTFLLPLNYILTNDLLEN